MSRVAELVAELHGKLTGSAISMLIQRLRQVNSQVLSIRHLKPENPVFRTVPFHPSISIFLVGANLEVFKPDEIVIFNVSASLDQLSRRQVGALSVHGDVYVFLCAPTRVHAVLRQNSQFKSIAVLPG